jgi:uncharacterized membrane protein
MEKKTKYEIIFVLIMLLLIDLSYLVYSHYSPTKNNFCDITNKFNCDIVNKSIYSSLFQIPIAIIGFFGFLVILYLFYEVYLGSKKEKYIDYIGALLIVAILSSLILIFIQSFILNTFCLFCMLGDLIILAITAMFVSLDVKINNKISLFVKILLFVLLFGILYAAFNAFLL